MYVKDILQRLWVGGARMSSGMTQGFLTEHNVVAYNVIHVFIVDVVSDKFTQGNTYISQQIMQTLKVT